MIIKGLVLHHHKYLGSPSVCCSWHKCEKDLKNHIGSKHPKTGREGRNVCSYNHRCKTSHIRSGHVCSSHVCSGHVCSSHVGSSHECSGHVCSSHVSHINPWVWSSAISHQQSVQPSIKMFKDQGQFNYSEGAPLHITLYFDTGVSAVKFSHHTSLKTFGIDPNRPDIRHRPVCCSDFQRWMEINKQRKPKRERSDSQKARAKETRKKYLQKLKEEGFWKTEEQRKKAALRRRKYLAKNEVARKKNIANTIKNRKARQALHAFERNKPVLFWVEVFAVIN